MKHLTDEQLGARLDGELPARDAEAAERHLAECEACRERLAALAGADAALSRALDRDPGEAYFASFADRVQARIAAGAAAEPAREPVAAPAPKRSWFARPAVLAWAGAAAALAVVGVFAVQFANQNAAGGRATLARDESLVGAGAREMRAAAPPQASAPELSSGPAVDAAAPAEPQARSAPPQAPAPDADAAARERLMSRELANRAPAASTPAPAPVRPQRAQELRTLENGEQVPITRDAPPLAKQKTFATAPAGEANKPPRMPALPMSPAPATAEKRMDAVPETPIAQKSAARLQLGSPAPQASSLPAPAAVPPPPPPAAGAVAADEGAASVQANEVATFRTCGRVTDTNGRPLAGATVTVIETGASATADADGRWCVDAPSPRATVTALAVGFRETRAVARAESPEALALRLAPVSALGGDGMPVGRLKGGTPPASTPTWGQGAPRPLGDAKTRAEEREAPAAPRVPALAGETAGMLAAREATETALRTRTVPAWTRAGVLWSAAAANAPTDALTHESLYRAAEARVQAWRLARGDANRRAALDALAAFLAHAPAGAQRDSAEKWRRELPER